MARDLMQCAECGVNIPKGKYIIRKLEKAIMHAVNKQLLYNVIQLQRQPSILCSNVSKSLYVRILHSVESMEIQILGMPTNPMNSMQGTLQDQEHHIRTSYGTS